MHNDIRFILAQVAEVQLSYKSKVSVKDRPMVRNSQDTYDILMQIWDQDTLELAESFKVLFLNRGRLREQTPAAAFFNQPATPEAAAFLRGELVW